MFRSITSTIRSAMAGLAATTALVPMGSAIAMGDDWYSFSRVEADVGRSSGETQRGIEADGWVGGDTHRLRWRLQGESPSGVAEPASGQLLYGRRIADYWDVVAGVRHDRNVGGVERNYAVIGLTGLAPYSFDVDATLAWRDGQALIDVEARHEMLLTQRVVVYPFTRLSASSSKDAEIGLGAGVNRFDIGFGLRYEFTRRVGVYGTVSRRNLYGLAADAAASEGEKRSASSVRAGLRVIF